MTRRRRYFMGTFNPAISKFDVWPLGMLHALTRLDKLVPRSHFENYRHLLLERERGQRTPMLLFLLNALFNDGKFFHDLNLYSLAVHFPVKLCRFKTALSERRLTAPASKNMLMRK